MVNLKIQMCELLELLFFPQQLVLIPLLPFIPSLVFAAYFHFDEQHQQKLNELPNYVKIIFPSYLRLEGQLSLKRPTKIQKSMAASKTCDHAFKFT